jgi:hypothetical protein
VTVTEEATQASTRIVDLLLRPRRHDGGPGIEGCAVTATHASVCQSASCSFALPSSSTATALGAGPRMPMRRLPPWARGGGSPRAAHYSSRVRQSLSSRLGTAPDPGAGRESPHRNGNLIQSRMSWRLLLGASA